MIPAYELIEIPSRENWCIRINDSKFKGIVFEYGQISIEEDGEDAILHFTYDTIDISEELSYNCFQTPDDILEFKQVLGDILVNILTEETNNRESRTDNSNEFSKE